MKMNKNITRRYALVALVATISFFPSSILAFSKSDAEGLIKNLTVDVLSAVNEQISEEIMFSKFEMIFSKYADVPLIARKALGPKFTSPSAQQRLDSTNSAGAPVAHIDQTHDAIVHDLRIPVTIDMHRI